jgi:hypothetical protein
MHTNESQNTEDPTGFRLPPKVGLLALLAVLFLSVLLGSFLMRGNGHASTTTAATLPAGAHEAVTVSVTGPLATRIDRSKCRVLLAPRADGKCPVLRTVRGQTEYQYGKYFHVVHRTPEEVAEYLADSKFHGPNAEEAPTEAFLLAEDLGERVYCGGCVKGDVAEETQGPVTLTKVLVDQNNEIIPSNGATK